MKSIDKLYQFLEDQFGSERFAIHSYGYTQGVAIAELIEEEISDNYMCLPVDADGVPIHVGDNLHSDETGRDFPCRGYNMTLQSSKKWWTVECCYDSYSGTSEYVSAKSCHHVKPRTLEDVFRDCCDEYHEACKSEYTMNPADIYRKYADEARELLGGDAE